MKKIVILGAAGHVGSYITLYAKDYFANKGFEIIIASGRRKEAKEVDVVGLFEDYKDEMQIDRFLELRGDGNSQNITKFTPSTHTIVKITINSNYCDVTLRSAYNNLYTPVAA